MGILVILGWLAVVQWVIVALVLRNDPEARAAASPGSERDSTS